MNEKAREIERRFASLPAQAGIVFISVQPQPVEEGKSSEFFVRLGIERRFEAEMGKSLAKKILEPELRSGLKVFIGVYRGIPCACV